MPIKRLLRTLRDEFLEPSPSIDRTPAADAAARIAEAPRLRLAAAVEPAVVPAPPPGLNAAAAEVSHHGLREHPAIAAVLQADHAEEGRLVGLTLASQEAKERGIDRKRAIFRIALQNARGDLQGRCHRLQHSLLDVGTGSDLMIRKLRLEISQAERELAELDAQEKLAAENEGIFRAVLHAYTEGFHRGQHEKHFGGGRFFP